MSDNNFLNVKGMHVYRALLRYSREAAEAYLAAAFRRYTIERKD